MAVSPDHPGSRASRHVWERRGIPRIDMPFPAIVRGVDWLGEHFTVEAVLDNLSTTGLYMRLARPVAPGTRLFVVVYFATAKPYHHAAPGVAVQGVVTRAEPRLSRRWGVAMRFTRHRLLYSSL